MRNTLRVLLTLLVPALLLSTAAAEEKFVFETWSKQIAEGYKGSFEVPENRSDKDSRMIPIHYVRFPATVDKAGPPIVYLAGGPGGSGIMTVNYRFGMFMALREYGDVIALDQRGTGDSNIIPECASSEVIPATTEISDEEFIGMHQNVLRECLAFWEKEGVNLAGYNTIENARDLDALREHLGAEKIVLWGTSYGSHLALAAIKEIEDKIERVVISSLEGLDQTIKMPARTDRYFDRLQEAVNSQPAAKTAYPDIKALMTRVHAQLEKEPVLLQLKSGAEYLLQRRDMQELAGSFIADPKGAALLLGFYRTLDNGDMLSFDNVPSRFLLERLVDAGKPISMGAMSTAMDIASGMTANRKAEISVQAETSLLGSYLNFTYHFDGMVPELDLGDEFRAKPASDVPVMLLSGTLDGRTYVESQLEAVSELTNVTAVAVKNAGHNLFMSSDEVQEAINRFMEDKPQLKDTITINLPDFAPQ